MGRESQTVLASYRDDLIVNASGCMVQMSWSKLDSYYTQWRVVRCRWNQVPDMFTCLEVSEWIHGKFLEVESKQCKTIKSVP